MKNVVLLVVFGFLLTQAYAQEPSKYTKFRTGTFQYEGLGSSVEVIRTEDTQTEIYENGESKLILDIEWFNDSTYVLTHRESINAPSISKLGWIKTKITAVEGNRYEASYTTDTGDSDKCVFIKMENNYNLLWKIEKEGVNNTGYLFGTMHVFDERAFGFADSVMLALDECDVFALEVHPDSIIMATMKLMTQEDTTNYYKKSMTSEEYNNFKERFSEENGLDFDEIENKHPLNVKTFDDSYAGRKDRKTFIDIYLYSIAKTLDKKIIGLEPVGNQLQSLLDRSVNRARFGVKADTLLEKRMMNRMIDAYDKGNLERIQNEFGSAFAESPMMVKRNKDMVESIMSTLDERSLFSAVGAGHLMGKQSIIAMLEEEGYTVKTVSSTFTGVADSFKINSKLIPWEIHVDPIGGYQTTFPRDFTTLNQPYPNETEFGLDTLEIKVKLNSDLTSMRNTIIVYNDFPTGYYLESKEAALDAMEEELKLQGHTIVSSENVTINGNSGRAVKLKLQGKLNSVMHLFVRGNRIYKFIQQYMTEGEIIENENLLVENMTFLPYAHSEIKQRKVNNYNLPYFKKHRIEIDTSVDHTVYLDGGLTWYSDDPSTGNALNVEIYKVKDLFSIKDLDSFYVDYTSAFTTSNDTVISSKPVFKNGLIGHEVLATSKKVEGAYARYQAWMYDGYAVVYSVYSDSSGVYCENAESFLNAQLFAKPPVQKRLLEDKTSAILSQLYSTDSLKASNALYALGYNVIDTIYAEEMEAVFLAGYMNDTLHLDQSEAIQDLLYGTPSFDAEQLSYTIAKNYNAPDNLRSCAISKLYEFGDTLAAIDIVFQAIPETESYWCDIFSPFSSSEKLTNQYFDQLVGALRFKEYHITLGRIINNFSQSINPNYVNKVRQNYDKITANFTYEIDSAQNITEYEIYNYLNFFSSFSDDRNKANLSKIDTTGLPNFVLSNLAVARLKNNISIDTQTKDELLSNPYLKHNIQKLLIQTGRKEELPESLRSNASVYNSKMEYYLEDDCYECQTELLGTIKDSLKTKYFVYRIQEGSDNEKRCLIGLMNHTKEKGKTQFDDIKVDATYFEGCDFSDWKQLAKDHLHYFEEYAY